MSSAFERFTLHFSHNHTQQSQKRLHVGKQQRKKVIVATFLHWSKNSVLAQSYKELERACVLRFANCRRTNEIGERRRAKPPRMETIAAPMTSQTANSKNSMLESTSLLRLSPGFSPRTPKEMTENESTSCAPVMRLLRTDSYAANSEDSDSTTIPFAPNSASRAIPSPEYRGKDGSGEEQRGQTALSPEEWKEIMKAYPNGASLSPAPDSVPLSPKEYVDLMLAIDASLLSQKALGHLGNQSIKYWETELDRLDCELRMLDRDFVLYSEGENEMLTAGQARVMEKLGENRRKWEDATREVYMLNSWREVHELECSRAYRYGGILHVGILEEKLDRVAEVLWYSNLESWEFTRWDKRRLDWYFGGDDEFLNEEEEGDLNDTAEDKARELLHIPRVKEVELRN